MRKSRKPKYYVAQFGTNTDFNWSIPENNTPSVVNQTNTGASDIYGNQYFKPDNTGDATKNNPDIIPITSVNNKKSIWDLFGNTNKTELNPAIQTLNAGMQTVTGVADIINEAKNRKYEKDQHLKAITPKYYENMEGYGLNANPVFTKYGGMSKYQAGGQPTLQDSLSLYNNSKAVAAYYNNPDYKLNKTNKPKSVNEITINNNEALDQFNASGGAASTPGEPYGKKWRNEEHLPLETYRKDVNKNQYYQRERANVIMDTRAPMTLFDKRIKPQYDNEYENVGKSTMKGDVISLYQYDPIAVKPWNMLTPAEREIRIKKYGYNKSGDNGEPLPYPNLNFKPSEVKDSDNRMDFGNKKTRVKVYRSIRERDIKHNSDGSISEPTGLLEYNPGYNANVPEPGYKAANVTQQPTKFSASYRDENEPSKQKTIYFKNKEEWQNFMNSGAISGADTKETSDSASATGYRRMQMGGEETPIDDNYYRASAKLSYYKDILNQKLKAKNPSGFSDYFKQLMPLRLQGKTKEANDFIQNSSWNDYLSNDEVRNTLGNNYNDYLDSIKSVNSFNIAQGRQGLYGTVEGEGDIDKLNYGRRFASLILTPSYSAHNKTSGTSYSRQYAYDPNKGQVNFTETGDVSLRPTQFNTTTMKNGGHMNFKSNSAYKKWLAYGHATKEFENTPGNQSVSIKGKHKNVKHAQFGDDIPETYGLQEGGEAMANVNAEKGEALQYNDGTIGQVAPNANTHEQGGVYLPNVHRVLENTSNIRKDRDSKLLKMSPQAVKAATGVDTKKSMSHAEALIKANEYYDGERNKITKKLGLAAKDRQELDKYGDLSTKLNMHQFDAIPTKDQLFESLFNHQEAVKAQYGIGDAEKAKYGGGLSREEDYGSKSHPYPSVSSGDFAGGGRSYPIPTKADAEDALRLAHLHGRSDVISKVYAKYPDLRKQYGGDVPEAKTGIHIKPENKGKFTAYKKRTGKTTEEALHSKDPHVRQMANFARNAAKWHHKGQYGGDIDYMQLAGYAGNKSGMKTPAGNSDAFPSTKDYSFQNYLEDLTGKGFKHEGITNPKDFQLALYDYQLKNNPDVIRKMWSEGMHQAGMAQAQQLGLVDNKGNFKQGVLDKPENLQKLRDIYADGILGVRTMNLTKKPPRIWSDEDIPTDNTPQLPQRLDTTINTPNFKQQPQSKFDEPLHWYDVASPVNAYMAALERDPGKYNPMEFNQLRYKLLDPTAALQQNQADFNAGLQTTQAMSANNPGAGMANIANLAAQKYAANNQVLGNYENQNAQIKNNEINYNTQVRDKNSAADQQAREVFEGKVLTSKAIQQEQKLTALDSLYKTIAENRALNRNGNLVMKFSRAFDQYGNYNGYAPQFTINPTLGINNSLYEPARVGAAGGVQGLAAGKNYYNRKTGKTLYFDGTKLIER